MRVRRYLETRSAHAEALYANFEEGIGIEDPRSALKELLAAFDRGDYQAVEEGLKQMRTEAENRLTPGENQEDVSAYLSELDILIGALPGSSEER